MHRAAYPAAIGQTDAWRIANGQQASSRATSNWRPRLDGHGEVHPLSSGLSSHHHAGAGAAPLRGPAPLPPAAATRLLQRPRACRSSAAAMSASACPAQLGERWRLVALTSDAARVPALRALGIRPLVGNLDEPATLRRLAALAPAGAASSTAAGPRHGRRHLPPAGAGVTRRRRAPAGHGSTTGVHGRLRGRRASTEIRLVAPASERRARRRRDRRGQAAPAGGSGRLATILPHSRHLRRRPPGGHPRERGCSAVRRVLRAEDDVHTNHIHADDSGARLRRRAAARRPRQGDPRLRRHRAEDGTSLRSGRRPVQAARHRASAAPRRRMLADAG